MTGHPEIGPAFHSQFQDEVVLWIGQERPPKEEDRPQIRIRATEVYCVIDVTTAQIPALAHSLSVCSYSKTRVPRG